MTAVEGDDDAPDPLLANDTVEPIDGSQQRERQAIDGLRLPKLLAATAVGDGVTEEAHRLETVLRVFEQSVGDGEP